ncbi:retinoid-inducible serine carboxypeptidase [Hydra vulgaris]|uniref:Retinoid-inducible serine carboxypeptidase n=1 Tax=Hydra vulgaris TaxID=6087 RepID=T2M5P7_HYDVU|nr:retinoid-inducible serine carboxypeptidase [Hydra vulgaris]
MIYACAIAYFNFLCVTTVLTVPLSSNSAEDWGYVNIRQDAYTFWWLYSAEDVEKSLSLPLVLWLQGGPGASSTGFGNFMEIGPLDSNLNPRQNTWVKISNLLFVDNPVGAGFSYVTNPDAYTRNVTQIAEDLYIFLKYFFSKKPEFSTVPFYITCESYGGKMTSAFGVRLLEGIKNKDINCNFKGVALGDSWISPVDSVMTWGPYLYQYNLLDEKDLQTVMDISNKTAQAVLDNNFSLATDLWSETEEVISSLTDNVNVYNVLQHNAPELLTKSNSNKFYNRYFAVYYQDNLSDLMNGAIRKKLRVIPDSVTWGGQSNDVFKYQSEDFMKPVIKAVDILISSGIKVVVYQGQLDMICDTPGAELWIKKLQWNKLESFLNQKRIPLYVKEKGSDTQGFLKKLDNFSLYYIMNAGHMVPTDNSEMALEMLQQILNDDN